MLALPLNVSIDLGGPLSANNYRYLSVPTSAPLTEGAFFKDGSEEMLYSYAGFNNDSQTATKTMATFNTTSQTWGSTQIAGDALNIGGRIGGLNANSDMTSEGLGFFLGGSDNITGMVTFDAQKQTWRKKTDPTTPNKIDGQMIYKRFGSQGTLVAIGGLDKNNLDGVVETGTIGATVMYGFRSMTNISVYDIASKTWWNVTTAGDIPGDRINFCSAVSYAPDDSRLVLLWYLKALFALI